MKNKGFKLLPFIVFLLSVTFCHAQNAYLVYPKADIVYTKFFETYSVKNLPSLQYLQFQKKPDGWHVVQLNESYDSFAKDELFWSRRTKSFQKINFDPIRFEGENKENLATFRQDFKNYYFNLFPYYNYPAFDWDIIQEYGDQKNLPDSIEYALGRSYSYFADNMLNNNSGMSDKRFLFTLKDGPDALSPEQLAKYRKYHNLAIETFKEVKKMNPDYVTMVGDIGLKLADEYTVGYLDMLVYQNDDEAKKELPDNIFDDFMIAMAKNYLKSCDSNAMLVTYGDNDTYPLLYVQAKYKYRTDVLIVNNELINVARYANRVRRPFLGAQALPLTMTPEQYKDGVRDYLFYYNNPSGHFSDNLYSDLKSVMDFMTSSDTANMLEVTADKSGTKSTAFVNYLPTNKFKLSVNKENVLKSKILSTDENKDLTDEINWKFNGTYLLKGNLMLLDVLLANDWKRPLCFTNGNEDQYLGLNNYMKQNGLVYELVPVKNESSQPFFNPIISTADSYDLYMHKFKWGGISSGKYICESETRMAGSLRACAWKLANQLIDESKNDSALNVLNLCMDSIPEKNCPYDYQVKFITHAYYRAGGAAKANSISKKLFKSYEEQLIKLSKANTGKATVNPGGYVDVSSLEQEAKISLRDLTRFAKNFNQDALYNDYLQRMKALVKKGLIAQEDIDTISAN